MILTNIKLTNFRTYNSLNLEFSPKFNIIYGNNGEGKTNLVESIYLLALSKSFRVNNDKILIKKSEKELIVEGKIKTKFKTTYKVKIKEDEKEVFIDNNKQSKLSDYVSNINVILFNPDDVGLIKDSPVERRKLLNIEISKMNKDYLLLLNNYNLLLKQRNSYLKVAYTNKNVSYEYLDIITKKLAEYGFKIANYRKNFIENINLYIHSIYKSIFGYGELEVKYISEYKNKDLDQVIEMYKGSYNKELEYGKTLYGIHHDDLSFILDKNKLKDWGSVGQHKNSIIAFKLAEIQIIKDINGEMPILILDDLFSELDINKIKNILNLLNKDIQIFITTTDIQNFDENLFKEYKMFKIENKQIMEDLNGKQS